MAENEKAVVIRGAINSTDALCVVATLTGDIEATVEAEMIYPYYCFDARCTVPTMTGRKAISMICLVDAVNGLGATADSFELKKETFPRDQLIDEELESAESEKIAMRTVMHRLGR